MIMPFASGLIETGSGGSSYCLTICDDKVIREWPVIIKTVSMELVYTCDRIINDYSLPLLVWGCSTDELVTYKPTRDWVTNECSLTTDWQGVNIHGLVTIGSKTYLVASECWWVLTFKLLSLKLQYLSFRIRYYWCKHIFIDLGIRALHLGTLWIK